MSNLVLSMSLLLSLGRPLPDERPRPSVANLIERFQHQQKKQPTSPSMQTRSLSAVSHTTGDSAKEEIKEKREWPPRSISATSHVTGDAAKEAMKKEWPPRAAVAATGDFTQEWPPKKPATEASISPGSTPPNRSPLSRASSQSIPLIEEPSEPETVEPEEKPVPKRQTTIDAKPVPVVVPAPKVPTPSTTKPVPKVAKTTPKPPAKAPPPSSFAKPSSLHPSKSDTHDRRTPTSTAPTASTSGRYSRPTSRATVRSKTPSAAPPPAQPKTPSKVRVPPVPRIPAAVVRPPPMAITKTPSTGLYAPTAASLGKSRNAPPSQPERKKTLSSSVSMDRLSKPTAASLSRARKPAVVATPPPPQRKVATPSKPRASAPARMKPPVVRGKDVVAAAAAGAAVAALLEAEETVELDHTNGHAASTDGEHDFDSEMLSDSMVGSHPDIVL